MTQSQPLVAAKDQSIDAALLALMGRGAPITHDAVAAESGVSRRTVYRRFADQKALRARIWELLSPPQAFERDLEGLLSEGLAEQFGKFDQQSAAMTVTMASAEGRAIRNQLAEQRRAYYRRIFEPALIGIAEPRRTELIAVMQLLCSGLAWREMRDQWELDGSTSAQACAFAIRAILKTAAETV